MFMPRRWRATDFGRRYYTAGWEDGVAGHEHAYLDIEAGIELIDREGATALVAYSDGYKAGQDAAEKNTG